MKSAAPPPPTQQGQPVAEKKSSGSNFIREALSRLADTHNADSDYSFSFGNLFRCLCCPREGASPNDVRFNTIMKSIEVSATWLRRAVGWGWGWGWGVGGGLLLHMLLYVHRDHKHC